LNFGLVYGAIITEDPVCGVQQPEFLRKFNQPSGQSANERPVTPGVVSGVEHDLQGEIEFGEALVHFKASEVPRRFFTSFISLTGKRLTFTAKNPVSAEDLRRLAQLCLSFADEVDAKRDS
jgi:hypothetical protein